MCRVDFSSGFVFTSVNVVPVSNVVKVVPIISGRRVAIFKGLGLGQSNYLYPYLFRMVLLREDLEIVSVSFHVLGNGLFSKRAGRALSMFLHFIVQRPRGRSVSSLQF